MQTELLVVSFPVNSLTDTGFEGRDDIENPLHDALVAAGIGLISGGGSGNGGSNIDVEITDARNLAASVELVLGVLRSLNAPKETTVRDDDGVVYRL